MPAKKRVAREPDCNTEKASLPKRAPRAEKAPNKTKLIALNAKLFVASQLGDLEAVRSLILEQGAEISAVQKVTKYSPLHSAAAGGHAKVVDFLISQGASQTHRDRLEDTPLHLATRGGHPQAVAKLMSPEALLAVNINGHTPLHLAANRNCLEVVAILLSGCSDGTIPNVTCQSLYNATPLHEAATAGGAAVTELLLAEGAKATLTTSNGHTPLHYAASSGHLAVVRLLLDTEADVNAIDTSGNPPMHNAAGNGYTETVKTLLSAGAIPTIADHVGRTALHQAAQLGHIETMKCLIPLMPSLEIKTKNTAETPLHSAAALGTNTMADTAAAVQLLIASGSCVLARTEIGQTPLMLAVVGGRLASARVLAATKESLFATCNKGFTALHMAAWYGRYEVADALIGLGASVKALSHDGSTPLMCFRAADLRRQRLSPSAIKRLEALLSVPHDPFLCSNSQAQ